MVNVILVSIVLVVLGLQDLMIMFLLKKRLEVYVLSELIALKVQLNLKAVLLVHLIASLV